MEHLVLQGVMGDCPVVSANGPLNTPSGLFVTRPEPGSPQHFTAITHRPFLFTSAARSGAEETLPWRPAYAYR
jgi:hypothetical protein